MRASHGRRTHRCSTPTRATRRRAAAATVGALGVLALAPLALGPDAAGDDPSARGPRLTAASAATDAPSSGTGWEARASRGAPVDPPRPEPVLVAEDLGAVDPRPLLADPERRAVAPIFEDRRLITPPNPWLVDPPDGRFHGSVHEVPDHVARRSTWRPDCPVTLDELRWVKVTHVGFDGRAHAGELLVHRDAAEPMVEVFRRLFEARYPIEKMRIAGAHDPSIGHWWDEDDNTTTAFVCRQSVAGGKWSQHAYGLAIDINPYHNPYVKGDMVIPPTAHHYLERDDRPGVIRQHDVVWSAFREELGWYWGGTWSSSLDYMHFSWNDH